MEVIKQLIGRLHPIIVHLPIGFIIAALLLQWYDRKKKNNLAKIVALLFLWGGISAATACISGYLLYLNEGYTFDTVKFHLGSGIITALFSLFMYVRQLESFKVGFLKRIPSALLSISLLILISLSGHLGGSITHGGDYLIEPLPGPFKKMLGYKLPSSEMPILDENNWEQAVLYTDLVQPILNNRCVSCHNAKKEKGQLQLLNRDGILKGGENGTIIEPNDPAKSSLYSRLILPLEHEDHMPPKDKSQLGKAEIEIIKIWIAHGNTFNKSIKELGLSKNPFHPFFLKKQDATYPNIAVGAVAIDTLLALKKTGIHVEKISEKSDFLKVSCINKPTFKDSDFELFRGIHNQIVYLDLGNTQITDAIFDELATLPNLTILKLDNTSLHGKNIEKLKGLPYLKSINLTSTNFEESQLPHLSSFKKLRTVYLYNTKVNKPNPLPSQKADNLYFDFGAYDLPALATDTIVY